MKIAKIVLLVLMLFRGVPAYSQQNNDIKILYDTINSGWSQRNYNSILLLLNQRLNREENDVLALSLKQYYYVFAEEDTSKAHAAANAFLAAIEISKDDALKNHGRAMAKRVIDISEADSTPFTTEQRDIIHSEMQNFPFVDECFAFWARFSGKV